MISYLYRPIAQSVPPGESDWRGQNRGEQFWPEKSPGGIPPDKEEDDW